MQKLAIIGSGIAGMGCAYLLKDKYEITLFEKANYIGGHTNTITLEEAGKQIFLDTGFMVFNYQTYPNLTKLFDEIEAPVMKTDMSFSVQYLPKKLEYCGSSMNHLFAQRRNILNISFIKMLAEINRFNKKSIEIIDDPAFAKFTVEDYFTTFKFSKTMLWQYLIPMSAAVWSAPMEKILEFPAVSLIRFFKNHGFLGLNTQHQWFTLKNGSNSYKEKLIHSFYESIKINSEVTHVQRLSTGKVSVQLVNGTNHTFDKVILASHADESFKMVKDKNSLEVELLSKFQYQLNKAVVHTDANQMPKNKRAWSSWNYRVEEIDKKLMPSTIYWMNKLQGVSPNINYFVSINPTASLDQQKVIKEIDYYHPLFSVDAMLAQEKLSQLNEKGPIYYCGSYFKYGFHEDAYKSAVDLCLKL